MTLKLSSQVVIFRWVTVMKLCDCKLFLVVSIFVNVGIMGWFGSQPLSILVFVAVVSSCIQRTTCTYAEQR